MMQGWGGGPGLGGRQHPLRRLLSGVQAWGWLAGCVGVAGWVRGGAPDMLA